MCKFVCFGWLYWKKTFLMYSRFWSQLTVTVRWRQMPGTTSGWVSDWDGFPVSGLFGTRKLVSLKWVKLVLSNPSTHHQLCNGLKHWKDVKWIKVALFVDECDSDQETGGFRHSANRIKDQHSKFFPTLHAQTSSAQSDKLRDVACFRKKFVFGRRSWRTLGTAGHCAFEKGHCTCRHSWPSNPKPTTTLSSKTNCVFVRASSQ